MTTDASVTAAGKLNRRYLENILWFCLSGVMHTVPVLIPACRFSCPGGGTCPGHVYLP